MRVFAVPRLIDRSLENMPRNFLNIGGLSVRDAGRASGHGGDRAAQGKSGGFGSLATPPTPYNNKRPDGAHKNARGAHRRWLASQRTPARWPGPGPAATLAGLFRPHP